MSTLFSKDSIFSPPTMAGTLQWPKSRDGLFRQHGFLCWMRVVWSPFGSEGKAVQMYQLSQLPHCQFSHSRVRESLLNITLANPQSSILFSEFVLRSMELFRSCVYSNFVSLQLVSSTAPVIIIFVCIGCSTYK